MSGKTRWQKQLTKDHAWIFCGICILLRTRNLWVNDLIQLLQSGTERQTAYFFVGHTHTDHALVPSLEDLRTDAILQKYTGSAQFLESYITNGALDYVQVQ